VENVYTVLRQIYSGNYVAKFSKITRDYKRHYIKHFGLFSGHSVYSLCITGVKLLFPSCNTTESVSSNNAASNMA